MQLRKLLVAGAAVAATGAMALGPAVQADDPTGDSIDFIGVGGSTADIDYDAAMTLKAPASVNMEVANVDTKLTCSGGNASAIVHAGAYTTGPAMSFTSLNLNCDSFIPGQTVTMSVPSNGCAKFVAADDNVHDSFPFGTVDTGPKDGKVSVVDGTFEVIAPCEVTVTASICTIKIGGSTPAQFDEAVKDDDPITQDFHLKGNGLTITDVSPLCFGAVQENDNLTINNVEFNTVVTEETESGDPATGPIDFRLTEQP